MWGKESGIIILLFYYSLPTSQLTGRQTEPNPRKNFTATRKKTKVSKLLQKKIPQQKPKLCNWNVFDANIRPWINPMILYSFNSLTFISKTIKFAKSAIKFAETELLIIQPESNYFIGATCLQCTISETKLGIWTIWARFVIKNFKLNATIKDA